MCSLVSVVDGANEGSCFTRSIFLVRLYDAALRRQVVHTYCATSDDMRDGRRERERRDVDIVVLVV